MKKILILTVLIAVVTSACKFMGSQTGKNGELTGVMDRPEWDNPVPYGMLSIPAGSFHMGQNDQDVNYSQIAHNRQITMSAFYMDETEIENNEYRQFTEQLVPRKDTTGQVLKDISDDDKKLKTEIIRFLKDYYYKDYSSKVDSFDKVIYPDTSVWVRDFTYAYNEPLTENYYWHPAFDKYPVVGVNWYAAQAFCCWRTKIYNNHRTKTKRVTVPRFRLPTEAEWEYAARGGFQHKIYPWEGPYIKNSRGCLFANFKPGRGDYIADNFEYTCPAKTYWPNDYGLYNMPGNVAEWCEDDFEETGYSYAHDLNPIYRDPKRSSKPEIANKRRVIRGGSWKDVGYFLSVGTRSYEFADTAKSFVGFRTVMSVLGRSGAYGGSK